jgi:hypothetical protein
VVGFDPTKFHLSLAPTDNKREQNKKSHSLSLSAAAMNEILEDLTRQSHDHFLTLNSVVSS